MATDTKAAEERLRLACGRVIDGVRVHRGDVHPELGDIDLILQALTEERQRFRRWKNAAIILRNFINTLYRFRPAREAILEGLRRELAEERRKVKNLRADLTAAHHRTAKALHDVESLDARLAQCQQLLTEERRKREEAEHNAKVRWQDASVSLSLSRISPRLHVTGVRSLLREADELHLRVGKRLQEAERDAAVLRRLEETAEVGHFNSRSVNNECEIVLRWIAEARESK